MMYLADTHTALWWNGMAEKVGIKATSILTDPEAEVVGIKARYESRLKEIFE